MTKINKTFTKCAMALATTAALSFPASAALITQTQIFLNDGQDFLFDFAGLGLSDGTNGLLNISTGEATLSPGNNFGGIDLDQQNEFFDVGFEGTDLGRYACSGAAGVMPIPGSVGDIDCAFSLDIALDGAQLLSSLLDGMVSFSVNLSDAVTEFGEGEEIIVTLSYADADDGGVQPVSAPATLGMLGLGLFGYAAARRFTK